MAPTAQWTDHAVSRQRNLHHHQEKLTEAFEQDFVHQGSDVLLM